MTLKSEQEATGVGMSQAIVKETLGGGLGGGEGDRVIHAGSMGESGVQQVGGESEIVL